MSTTPSIESSLNKRSASALTSAMVVLPTDDSERFKVVSDSGRIYAVDLRAGVCDCPDCLHRGVRCRHIRRAEYARGERTIPAWVDRSRLDPLLGQHVSGAPRIERVDGTTEVLEA
ncbi:hypothetical protein Hbl1158_02815 [Halobaculum sp. CBA1158]|uniref:hypothetical protein n=1 Tax=Halobaculum sp. CBA1158 TaxID=2904243 RepID=UPI001F451A68|nr:hypothetical protein [Halobaculum sp. CBA1158]UIP00319.1 hypothetical protein Hbl1158_02815 [Halobaculum sp. CBA1158]